MTAEFRLWLFKILKQARANPKERAKSSKKDSKKRGEKIAKSSRFCNLTALPTDTNVI